MTARVEHPYELGPEAFWEVFFDRSFTDRALREVFDARAIEWVEDRGRESRTLRVTPSADAVPALVRAHLPSDLSYVESGAFDADRQVWAYRLALPVRGFEIAGEISVRPTGAGRCVRVDSIVARVPILGVGGLLEKALERSAVSRMGALAAFTNSWARGSRHSGASA